MSAFSTILFLIIFSFFTMTYGLEQFVSPHGSCGLNCSGDSITPYDNLLIALIKTQAEDDVTIYLLNDPSTPHYILSKEYTNTSNLTFLYDIPASLTLNLKKRVIQPLFCGEEPALSNPNLESQCISRDEKLTVYVKTTEFTLNILQSMAIYNIVFDASEDVKLWNTNQNLLNNCIYNRKRCCEDPNNPSVALINCKKSGDYSRLGLVPSKSLFSLKSPNFTSLVSFSSNNTDFTGFLSPNVISLINTGNNPFSIEFDNAAITNIYFSKGLIYHDQDSETFNFSRITITNMQFVNYNPTDLLWVSPNRTEGYLLLADSYYYGNLTIKDSIFAQAATSLRDECPFLSETYFTIPMTYALFGDAQEPRSNLWYLFHVDHRRVQNSSSLIFFTSFDGALSITNSSFTRILGTSGSVLRIDDVTQPQTFFTITNSSFDDNFSYDGFSNIRITKVSGAAFVNMLSCPKINILGSNFTNAYGCSGSYGNVLLLCYWDDSPTRDGALSSYDILNDLSNLNDTDDLNDLSGDLGDFDFTPTVSAYWKHRDHPEDCYITVKNCLFENNLASVSNSLAVIGSHFITLEGNIFQYNGGTTAEILSRRMSNSYFSSRYPDGFDSFFLIHFGQATTVYIDHFIRFYSISNQYRSNWGPWEGSLVLGETLTLKNWIILSNTIVFNSDYFTDHQGIPVDIGQDLWDVSLKENYFRAPIMTLGYDDKGTQGVYSQIYGTLTRDVKIIMNGVTFYNNTAKYDYNSYTYNLWNLSPLFQENYVKQQRFTSGFIKLLTVMESQDIFLAGSVADTKRNTIGFLWQNANISKNQLLSPGCLFPTQWCESYFVMDTQIIENSIDLDAENFQVVQEQDQPNLQNIKSNTHGLFCLYTRDSLLNWPNALFVMHNTTVRNNNGILVNHATNNNVTSQIFYSHFENNTCLAASMITVFDENQIFSLSNTFINNFNALGNIFIYKDTQYIGVQQTYLNNSGIHASLVYATESIRTIQIEVSARAYWNDINPEIPIFDSGTMAQGAPYFFDSVSVVIIQGDFRQNKAYSGLLNAIQVKIIVDLASINDHSIVGVSVIGNLMSISNIEMRNCEVVNNSISRHPDKYVSNIGIILLYTTKFRGENVNFINGTIDDGGVLMFGNSANVMLFDSIIQNYTKLDNDHNYLIWFTLTSANIGNLSCSDITNFLNPVSSDVNIIDLNIQNLQRSFGSQFIFQGFETSIRISNLAYTGNGQTGVLSALFQGDKNYFILVDSTITDATNTIFSLQTSKLFYLECNQFTFYQCPNQVTVADLSLTEKIAVISCVFSAAGTVLTASNTLSQLTFINNIIITNSETQTVLIDTAKGVIFKQNYIINEGTIIPLNLAQYQVQILDSSGPISLTNNHFWSLKASISPLIIQSQKSPYNASLIDNTFVNNEASYGGSLQLSVTKGWLDSETPQATIRNSVFLANKAIYSVANVQGSGRAGAFYLELSGSTTQSTLLESAVFVRNRAEGAGGAIYFEYSPPVIDESCFFKENYANNLSHIASYPVQIVQYNEFTPYKIYIPNQNRMRTLELAGQNIWEGVGSGVPNQGPYKFALLDIYGQMISDDNTSELQIWPDGYDSTNRSDFAPKLSAVANNGVFTFQDFVFNYKIKEKINVKFVSDAIQNDPNNPYTNVANFISIQVNFRECKIGEYMLETQGSTRCIECQPGYWNLGGGGEFATSCIECDLESTVCLGGAKVGPRPGYWRLNEMATIVKECPNSNACLGNVVDGSNPITEIDPQGKCREGFAGNLCNNCKEGWAKTSPTSNCINCQTNAAQYLQLVGLILFQMIFLTYNARKTMEIATQYFNNKGALELKNNAAILLRTLTNYMQIIELVGDIPVTWPTLIKDSMTVSSKASSASTQAFSIDCFYLLIKGFTGIRLVYLKVLLVTMTPLIKIALGVIFWVLYFKVKKMSVIGSKDLVNKIVTTMVIICFNLQPNIIKSCFELFQCTNLYREDSPILYLTSDYDVQCWDSEHYKWAIGLGLPCLLFWGIGLPVGMFVVLRRNYRKLDNPEIVKKYVFLYLGYKQERFYWEFVIMLRKLALVCIAVFAGFHSINLQIYLVVVVIVWSQVLQRVAQPYNDKNLNHLERVALRSAGIVDFCGLYFQIVGDVVGLNAIMIIIGLVGNLYFIVEFVRLYFIYQVEQLKQNVKVMKIINLIGDKLCCCFKTKSAARAMKKVKSAVQKSKNGITRSLKFIVADEEISTLNALTECKGPSKNDLTIENNISDESHPVNCVKLSSSKTSRLHLDEKEIIKEDIVREHESEDENEDKYEEESLPEIENSNDQADREEKLEPMNLASIVLDLDVNMTEIEKKNKES